MWHGKCRLLVIATIFSVLLVVAAATQLTLSPAPAQGSPPKITGKFSDTVIKSFDAAGLPGLHSIQYRRVSGSPGGKIEGDIVFDDHAELCIPTKGRVVATLPDGSKFTAKKGDIFTIPLGMKAKSIVFDSKLGWVDLCWSLNVKARK
jgi:quercetin dioxygenase-like cupin family protein